MKKLLFILPLLCLIAAGCRQNNGDIGELYGSWAITECTCDGQVPDEFTPDSTFFSFQNDIIRVSRTLPRHAFVARWGTWTRDTQAKTLTLDFGHSDNANPASTGPYAPPAWIGITQPTTTLDILSISGREMSLSQVNQQGTWKYTLSKTW